MDRRQLLRLAGGSGLALLAVGCTDPGGSGGTTGSTTSTTAGSTTSTSAATTTTIGGPPNYGPLQPTDANGLRVPAGFSTRKIAVVGQPVAGTGYTFPANPDGAATFATDGGGWVYAMNHESAPGGGASAIEFDEDGTIVGARSILGGTVVNCAGGGTPWDTWLSCEEVPTGQVWECDPIGTTPAVARPAMGRFQHEAVAVDPDGKRLYLTEDRSDGALYRFTPTTWHDLSAGTLEVMTESGGTIGWATVPDPSGAGGTETRKQVATAKRFSGGEGICYLDGAIFFTTKGDNRVWKLDTATNQVFVVYQPSLNPVLTGVDNVTVTPHGELYVAEDGGDMQIVMLVGSPGTELEFAL